jgi:hypothetical protein
MPLDYRPHRYQKAVHFSKDRFRVVVWHRRAGKSTLAVNEILRHAKDDPGRYWIVLPTYRQAKTVLWDLLKGYTPDDWVTKTNETTLDLRLFNGSEIALKGSENIDALRGVGLKGVVMDEYAFMDRRVWTEAIRPTLSDTKGWALFTGTPYGKNHFYSVYNYGLDPVRYPGWRSWQLGVSTSGLLPDDELATIRRESPQNVWEQEWEALFIDNAGQVFRRFRDAARSVEAPPEQGRLYRLGVDLARLQNFTVLSVVDRHTFAQVALERFQDLDWAIQRARIEALARRYNTAEIVIDVTGVGDPVVEDLMRMGLAIIPFKYTGEKKKLLVENLAKMLEMSRLMILKDEYQLREIEAFTYTMNPETGRTRYHAPEGMMDDCVNALALSVWNIGERLPLPDDTKGTPDTYFENPYG